MIWFFSRADGRRSCEVRLQDGGSGFEIIVTDNGASHVESFETIQQLLSREHELLTAWRAQGWRELTSYKPPDRPVRPPR